MGVSFGEPEAGETREGLVRFLARAQHGLTRRGATVALLATVGSLGEALTPSGALVDARTPFDPAALVRKGPRTLDLRPGFTDVGTIAVAYLTRRGHRGP